MNIDQGIAFLFWLIAHMRRKTGNPWWPYEPPLKVQKAPEVLMAQEIQLNITQMNWHRSGPLEMAALRERNRELKRRLEKTR